jgi:putative component of toxin-antitoxin plasmid stabilization module
MRAGVAVAGEKRALERVRRWKRGAIGDVVGVGECAREMRDCRSC